MSLIKNYDIIFKDNIEYISLLKMEYALFLIGGIKCNIIFIELIKKSLF